MWGAWFTLNFHVMFKTSFVVTRALFRVLCLGVSVSVFGLGVKLAETVLQLVVLVVVVIVGAGSEWLVQLVVLVIDFRVPGDLCVFLLFICVLICVFWQPLRLVVLVVICYSKIAFCFLGTFLMFDFAVGRWVCCRLLLGEFPLALSGTGMTSFYGCTVT